MNKTAAEAYILARYTLKQSMFNITINGVEITEANIEGQAGIIDGNPVDTGGEVLHHRPGFQFRYRTSATSLNIVVKEPISGSVQTLRL